MYDYSVKYALLTHKFTGKERDAESGLDDFDARYYSSNLGRFASPDPNNAGAVNEYPQSWNGYSYVRNNPLRYTDPDGLSFHFCIDDGNGGQNCSTYLSDQDFYAAAGSDGARLSGGIIYAEDGNGGYVAAGTYEHFGDGRDDTLAGTDDDPIIAPILAGGLYGGIKAGIRGLFGALFGGGAKAAAEQAVEQVLATGTKAVVKQAIEDAAISDGQKAAVKSALDRAASTAKVQIEKLADGSVRITTERAGRNGFQAIEKVVDASGATKSVVQKAYDAAGNLVHVDPKLP
jgi:RHS repeat-associated protein